MKTDKLVFKASTIGFPLLFVLIIWIVFWLEVRFGYNFNKWGVQPQKWSGLKGILFSPFIHGNIKHLYSNTLPLLILSTALFYFYRAIAWKVLGLGLLLSGLGTWFLGESGSVHIGASGIVYLLSSFLFFKGIWSKNYRLIALSLIVAFVYGGMVWGMLPIEEKVSWEGHLSGFAAGILLAVGFRKVGYASSKKYEWEKPDYKPEQDLFMQHFDEKGNFIPYSEWNNEEDNTQNDDFENLNSPNDNLTYRYIYTENKQEEENRKV